MTPETITILAKLDNLNAEFSAVRLHYGDNPWHATIAIQHDGAKLEARSNNAPTFDAAVQTAWAKISSIVDTLTFQQSFAIPLLTIDHSPKESH